MFVRKCLDVMVLASALIASQGRAQSPTITQPAQVEPYERANIYAKASGFVAAVHVDIGDIVEKGALLAELAIPEMEQERLQQLALVEQADAAILQAEARVDTARAKISAANSMLSAVEAQLEKHSADIAFARSELSRIATLVSSRAINASIQDEKQQQVRATEAALTSAQADIGSARSNVAVAQANQKQAQADLAYAQSQRKVAAAALSYTETLIQYAKIRAPFAGQISRRAIDTGDFVLSAASSKGDSLFTLNRVDRFRIVFSVPESSAIRIRVGQPIALTVDSVQSEKFMGEIKRTAGELDPRTRTLRAEAEVKDERHLLRPGMYGMVTITPVRE